jgi:hypothetical protein
MNTNRAGTLALIALLAGCSKCPDGDMAGTSAGCGNPIKTAELHTLSQNPCDNSGLACAGSWPRTPYSVSFGPSLSIKLSISAEAAPDSIRGVLYLFEGDQVPVFDKSPVDSIFLRDTAFQVTSKDMSRLRKRGSGDSSYSIFSAYVRLSFYVNNAKYRQAGLLTGLVFDQNYGGFSYSEGNPLSLPGGSFGFEAEIGKYQGSIAIPDSLLQGDRGLYVYVPGSPFFTPVNQGDRSFLLDSLPLREAYELRFFAMPITNQHGVRVPVFRLEAGSGSDFDRVFGLSEVKKESILLP